MEPDCSESTELDDNSRDHGQQFASVGEFLRYLRGKKSLRQIQDDTGITYSYLSNIERGAKHPGEKVLTRLADYHNVPLGTLFEKAGIGGGTNADHRFSNADIRRSFQFVLDDPRLVGYQKPNEDMPIAAQRFVVEMYQHFTGRRLLD